jgi:iron(III) transport system ATP-binding protein
MNAVNGPVVECRGVRKSFGVKTAVDGVSFSVAPGKLLALVGPSGCGKTTLLRVLAGFEKPDEGEISVAGRAVVAQGVFVPPEKRNVGLVFQDYALFPHMTVAKNVLYGMDRKLRAEGRLDFLLDLLGLSAHRDKYPHELSGGECQRVAVARAVAPRPPLILLDEPFANLDAPLRASMRANLRRFLHETGIAGVIVTHDQEEAISLADQLGVMSCGRLLQVGPPSVVYAKPATLEVASLLGHGNVLPARARDVTVETELGTHRMLNVCEEGECRAFIRAEAIRAVAPDAGLKVEVKEIVFYGHDQDAIVAAPSGMELRVRLDTHRRLERGDVIGLQVEKPVMAYPVLDSG